VVASGAGRCFAIRSAPPTRIASHANQWFSLDLPTAVAKLEAEMIRRALAASGGNRTEAARRLNINRQLLYTKAQRYGLNDTSEIPTDPVSKPDAS
jgi:DNA-binding NtrC family response regulator